MESKFIVLNNDRDVLLFNDETFIVSKFKQLIKDKIINNLSHYIEKPNSGRDTRTSTYSYMAVGNLTINNNVIPKIQELKLEFKSYLDCSVLRVGAKAWQKGTIKIIGTCVFPEQYNSTTFPSDKIDIVVEFYPKVDEQESPLEEIRNLLEHQQQL